MVATGRIFVVFGRVVITVLNFLSLVLSLPLMQMSGQEVSNSSVGSNGYDVVVIRDGVKK